MATINSNKPKHNVPANPPGTKTSKQAPKALTRAEEQQIIDAAIVDFSKPAKEDPSLADLDSPGYSPKQLRAKAMSFMSGPSATPAEKEALANILKANRDKKAE
jgi:hypothetical protein